MGFGFWCLYYCIASNKSRAKSFDDVITRTTRIAGLLFVLQFAVALLTSFFYPNEYKQYAFTNRAFGNYWLSFWLMLILPIFCTLVLWIKSLRPVRYLRLVIGFLLIGIFSIEKLIILFTSLHRDFIPNSVHDMLIHNLLLDYFYMLSIFVVINLITYFILKKFQKPSNNS
jgi:hypothetical protein